MSKQAKVLKALSGLVDLTPKQAIEINGLDQVDQLKYFLSRMGIRAKERPTLARTRRTVPDRSTGLALVHDEGNHWARKFERLFDATRDKVPSTKDSDWIGVEIECFLNIDDFDLDSANCECECTCGEDEDGNSNCDGDCREDCRCGSRVPSVAYKLRKARIKNVQAVEDGSLSHDSDQYFGVEIKVLFRLSDPSNLVQACEFLKKYNAIVNKSCGLHVHLDMRSWIEDKTAELMAHKYAAHFEFLKLMLPPSRLKNSYCKPGISMSDRYRAINATSLEKHGTLEIRAHSGTTDLTKILNWCKILTAVKTCGHVVKTSLYAELTPELQRYVTERIQKFNPEYGETVGEKDIVTIETVQHEDSETELLNEVA